MTTEPEFSLASCVYLRKTEDVGDATLRLTVSKNGEHFIAEVFDTRLENIKYIDPADNIEKVRTLEHCTPPKHVAAMYFIENRFKHGCKKISRKDVYHPIYEVPITDYTVHLIQSAWTGKKVISDVAKPYFQRIFLREFQAEQNAKRTACFKAALHASDSLISTAKSQAGLLIDQGGTAEQAKQLVDSAELEATKVILNSVPTNDWFNLHDRFLHETGLLQTDEPFEMKPYQKVGSFNCCMSKGYGYLCDPGLGKTLMMVRKLDYLISNSDRQTITLIVCPKTVRSNWENELNKFSLYGAAPRDPSGEFEQHRNKLFIYTLQGNTGTDRYINLVTAISSDEAEGKHIVILAGYESYVQTKRLQTDFEFDLLLADESHNFANPGTKRTKTFIEYRGKFVNAVIATGTFFRNSPFDGYGQLEILAPGASGFDNFTAFKSFYGVYIANQYNGRQQLVDFDASRIPLLQEKLAKYTFIMKKEEALPFLPKKTFSILDASLSKEQLRVYEDLQSELAAEIESYGPEPDTMTVNNILTQMLRLAQITSGYAATDGGTITRFDPNPKLDLLIEYLLGSKSHTDNSNGESSCKEDGSSDEIGVISDPNNKALVWCAFKENVKMIHQRLKLEGIQSVMFTGDTEDKDDVIASFNCDPVTRVFIGIAKSGGVGLNLVGFDPLKPQYYKTNTTNVIHYSANWSYVERAQADDRAHRYNTRVPVHIVDLLVPGSIDKEIYERVKAKREMGASMQDIKRILTAMVPQSV